MKDQDLNKLKDIIFKGWPEYRKHCPQELWEYWTFRCDLVIENGLILKGDRIIIPETLRGQVLEALHTGHQVRKLNFYFWQGSQYFGLGLQMT